MYRILLVDDEKMELEALKNYIDWEALGIDHVDTAKNGKAAYELVLEKQPDIVITDIQMPVMDGITLAKKIYEWNRSIKLIFLTGYDDFAYVKEAFQVNAVNYLLKPFSEESIAEVIHRAVRQIEKDNLFQSSVDMMEKVLLQRLCTEEQTPEETLLSELEQVSGDKTAGFFGMVQFFQVYQKNLDRSMEKKLAEIETVWLDGNTLTFLIWGYVDFRDAAFRIQKILEDLTGKSYSGVWLQRGVPKEGLRSAWSALKSWETELFYEEKGCLKPVNGPSELVKENRMASRPSEIADLQNQLEELLKNGKEAETGRLLDQGFSYFSKEKIRKQDVIQFLYRLFLKLEKKILPETENGKDTKKRGESLYESLNKCCCIEEARTYVNGILKGIEEKKNQQLGGSKTAYVVRKVHEYVQNHYSQSVTVEDMAAEIHFSANYIRTIFKEGTGQTILEYITNYRFERASELLKDPKYKVKEVSMQVGYENVSYFCSVFTKRYGVTPNEYRKKYL